MSIYDQKPVDFDSIETYDLKDRPSKVGLGDFARPMEKGLSVAEFLDRLPNILAGSDILQLAGRIAAARENGKPIIWGIGGHVIKTGLAPVLIDLAERGFLTAVASNGSVLVHDSEIAINGSTSEDVDESLGEGAFGAARQTGEILNAGASRASEGGFGLGEGVSEELASRDTPYGDSSLLLHCYRSRIPFTAHLTIGADIGHFHPGVDGAALGAATHLDFRLFCSVVREMDGGGVYINVGSAVVLPEVFLKAVTVTRNLRYPLAGITTANLDFIRHYRPITNVVKRPTAGGAGKGFSITGHHEITVPLLAAAILEAA